MKYRSVFNKYSLAGLLMLMIGSLALLACKLNLALWLELICIVLGGGIILFGNGFILYGILVNVDEYRPDMIELSLEDAKTTQP